MAYTQQTPIGTPDVNLITKTLAGLQPDSALQEYAALHKNNPYILSLAKSESDRRKALRTAAQGNPGQMPTVADREIAGMATPVMTQYGGQLQTGSGGRVQTELPENQGIAQIPTPNMRGMADGGIAGYEDDEEGMATGGMGGMFNFAQQSEPVVRMSGGGHIPRYQGVPKAVGGDGSVVSSNPMFNIADFRAVQPRDTFTQQGAPENTPLFQRLVESLSGGNKERQLAMIEQKIAQGTATPEEVAAYKEVKIKGGDKAATFDQQALRDAKYPPQDAIRTKDFPGVKPGFEKPPADMPGTVAADKPAAKKVIDSAGQASSKVAGNYPNTPEGYRQRLDAMAGTAAEAKDPFAAMQADIAAEEKAASLERKAEFEKGVTARGEAFKGREGRLAEREARLGKEDERNTGLALLEAGLGMMTSRGPGLSGIAEGAKAGVASFAAGKQRMLAAKDKLDDARDQIEEYRRNEANMTDKERRAMNDDINKTVIQGKKEGLAGIRQAYGVNKTEALKLLEVSANDQRSLLENQSRERAAGAGSPQALYRLLGNGDIEKGYRLATEIQAGKKTLAQSYEAYLVATSKNDPSINPPLTPQQFATQVRSIQMLERGVPGAVEGTPDRK
jgi:hypothetical protein